MVIYKFGIYFIHLYLISKEMSSYAQSIFIYDLYLIQILENETSISKKIHNLHQKTSK